MGISNTVAAAFMTMILLTGSAYVVSLNLDLMKTTTEPFQDYVETEFNRDKEECSIDTWFNVSTSSFCINVTNTGDSGVLLRDFDAIDVILAYQEAGGDSIQWLPYSQEMSGAYYWYVSGVYTNGESGDFLNRINLTDEIYGIWDPGETIELTCVLDDSVLEYNYFKVILPYGATTLKLIN